jgi:hypothetical protein
LVLVDQMTDAIIGRSECSLAWCSMLGLLQAISPGGCPEIVELALPELASLKQVPARKAMSIIAFVLATQPHGSDHGMQPPSIMQATFGKDKKKD